MDISVFHHDKTIERYIKWGIIHILHFEKRKF